VVNFQAPPSGLGPRTVPAAEEAFRGGPSEVDWGHGEEVLPYERADFGGQPEQGRVLQVRVVDVGLAGVTGGWGGGGEERGEDEGGGGVGDVDLWHGLGSVGLGWLRSEGRRVR
jgi:hypothetical protein